MIPPWAAGWAPIRTGWSPPEPAHRAHAAGATALLSRTSLVGCYRRRYSPALDPPHAAAGGGPAPAQDRSDLPSSAVTLIPSGLLALLPLHAAWTEDASTPTGRRYFLDEFTVSYAPSALALGHARERAEQCTCRPPAGRRGTARRRCLALAQRAWRSQRPSPGCSTIRSFLLARRPHVRRCVLLCRRLTWCTSPVMAATTGNPPWTAACSWPMTKPARMSCSPCATCWNRVRRRPTGDTVRLRDRHRRNGSSRRSGGLAQRPVAGGLWWSGCLPVVGLRHQHRYADGALLCWLAGEGEHQLACPGIARSATMATRHHQQREGGLLQALQPGAFGRAHARSRGHRLL